MIEGEMRALTVIVVVVALAVALLWAFQRHLIYLPDSGPVPAAASVLPGGRDVTLVTEDGVRLGAWFFPGAEPRLGATVLVAGGNAGNRGHRVTLARALVGRGVSVLLMDYRGYGGNEGSPAEEALAADARAARAFLDSTLPRGERLVYFGESLGAAVVTELATEHPPDGLLLRSPFTDLAAAGQANYPFLPVRLLLRDRFPLAERLASVRVPTTIVYGSRDTIVPPHLSRSVGEAAGGPVRVIEVPGAGHNDPVLFDGPDIVSAVLDLAERP
ncbi:alpha/beta hydrolase [Streptosporangium fragile]